MQTRCSTSLWSAPRLRRTNNLPPVKRAHKPSRQPDDGAVAHGANATRILQRALKLIETESMRLGFYAKKAESFFRAANRFGFICPATRQKPRMQNLCLDELLPALCDSSPFLTHIYDKGFRNVLALSSRPPGYTRTLEAQTCQTENPPAESCRLLIGLHRQGGAYLLYLRKSDRRK